MEQVLHEDDIEQIAIGYLRTLGYDHVHGPIIARDGEHPEKQYGDVVLVTRLRDAIDKAVCMV